MNVGSRLSVASVGPTADAEPHSRGDLTNPGTSEHHLRPADGGGEATRPSDKLLHREAGPQRATIPEALRFLLFAKVVIRRGGRRGTSKSLCTGTAREQDVLGVGRGHLLRRQDLPVQLLCSPGLVTGGGTDQREESVGCTGPGG